MKWKKHPTGCFFFLATRDICPLNFRIEMLFLFFRDYLQ